MGIQPVRDIVIVASECLEALRRVDQPHHERIAQALRCFSGCDLTHIKPGDKKFLEGRLLKTCQISSGYGIKDWGDYARIPKKDLLKIETVLMQICTRFIP